MCRLSPRAAVETLCALARRAPADLTRWHYDQVDAARSGAGSRTRAPASARRRICSCAYAPRTNRLEAKSGGVCAHVEAFESVEPRYGVDRERLEITRRTIAAGMITYPPLRRFPEVEDAGRGAINAALGGTLGRAQAVASVQRAAEEALR